MIKENYNEENPPIPEHGYPRQPKVDLKSEMGAYARLKLEEVASYAHGVNLNGIKAAGIEARDLIRYRSELHQALRAMIAEGRSIESDSNRDVAIAYVGALGLCEDIDVLIGIATNPQEGQSARASALDSLSRLGGDKALTCLKSCLKDPNASIQERAIRGLARAGKEEECHLLTRFAHSIQDPELIRLATDAVNQLATDPNLYELPKVPKRTRKKRRLIEERNIVRPIGQVNVAAPQTSYSGDTEGDVFGGRDLVGEKLAAQRVLAPVIATSLEPLGSIKGDKARFRVVGTDLTLEPCCEEAEIHKISPEEFIVDVPANQIKAGRPLSFLAINPDRPFFPVWVPEASPSPKILTIATKQPEVWAKEKFQLQVRFHVPKGQVAPLLKLRIQLPRAGWHELLLPISPDEQAAGLKDIGDYQANAVGEINVEATLYASGGGADVARATFLSLPPNPLSVNVVPQTRGTNGEGPAHFNSGENRYYCYARCTFINGFPHSVTIGDNVRCRVTDGGSHVATFDFSIGHTVIPANSSRVINIYTRHGGSSNVYGVFANFGDVRMDFTFETTEGEVTDWNVWAAMAQIKLALNFVGNISFADRASIQSIVENEASAILEQQSLYISESRRFLLPSSDPDFNRYRVIEMNDNKDEDCTAGSDEADDLRDDWSSPTDWLDVWIVESFSGPSCASGITGFSPVGGPTNKGGSNSGFVIRRNGRDIDTDDGRTRVGRTIAHELGHFLGLNHHDDTSNFMFRSNGLTRTDITHGQYLDMADHGFVERFVP